MVVNFYIRKPRTRLQIRAFAGQIDPKGQVPLWFVFEKTGRLYRQQLFCATKVHSVSGARGIGRVSTSDCKHVKKKSCYRLRLPLITSNQPSVEIPGLRSPVRVGTSYEIVEKPHLVFLRPISGVVLPFARKRSSIVDQMAKPFFFPSHEEIYSEAFSTISIVRLNRTSDFR